MQQVNYREPFLKGLGPHNKNRFSLTDMSQASCLPAFYSMNLIDINGGKCNNRHKLFYIQHRG